MNGPCSHCRGRKASDSPGAFWSRQWSWPFSKIESARYPQNHTSKNLQKNSPAFCNDQAAISRVSRDMFPMQWSHLLQIPYPFLIQRWQLREGDSRMEAQNKNSNPTQETVKARKTWLMSLEGQFRIGGRQLDNCKNKMEVGWQAEKFYVFGWSNGFAHGVARSYRVSSLCSFLQVIFPGHIRVTPTGSSLCRSSLNQHLKWNLLFKPWNHENAWKSLEDEDLRVEAFKKRGELV